MRGFFPRFACYSLPVVIVLLLLLLLFCFLPRLFLSHKWSYFACTQCKQKLFFEREKLREKRKENTRSQMIARWLFITVVALLLCIVPLVTLLKLIMHNLCLTILNAYFYVCPVDFVVCLLFYSSLFSYVVHHMHITWIHGLACTFNRL